MDRETGVFICSKAGSRDCAETWGKCPSWTKTIDLMANLASTQTTRQTKHLSKSKFYYSAGLRMDQNGNFGRYSLAGNATTEQENDLYKQIDDISAFVTSKMSGMVPSSLIKGMETYLDKELATKKKSRKDCALKGKGSEQSFFFQLSGGVNFWASAHTDADYTLSSVVAMSNKAATTTKRLFGGPDKTRSFYTEDDVAFFFVFPEYGLSLIHI